MKKFVISGLVGLLLLGVGLLKISGKTESMAFAQLSEGEMEVVESKTQVSHANDEMLTGRKVTWLSPEEMSIIKGGEDPCICYKCVNPGPGFCNYNRPDCNWYRLCRPYEPDDCGWWATKIPGLTICGEVGSGGKTQCSNDIEKVCIVFEDCTCSLTEFGWECIKTGVPEYKHDWTCNLSGDSC